MTDFVDVVEPNLSDLVKGVEGKIAEGYRFTDGNDTNVFDFKTYLHATLVKDERVNAKVDLGDVSKVTVIDYDIVGTLRKVQDAVLQGFKFDVDSSVPGVYYSVEMVRKVEQPKAEVKDVQEKPAAQKAGRKPKATKEVE